MKKIVITADSAADFPADIAEFFGIEIMPMNVIIDGKEKKDGVSITAPEIFDYVDRTGIIPKTSAVSPGEYTDFFEKFSGNQVIHFSFCSKLSSTHRNAVLAAAAFENVHVIDTLNLGGGIALPAIKACKMRDDGLTAEEIICRIYELIPRVNVSYLLNNIDFLRRSGRCSAAKAISANLLSIKPCAAMIDGQIEVIKKYRSKAKAARLQYAEEQLEKYKNIDYSLAFIYHSGVDSSELSECEKLLKSKGFGQVITAFTGCMISLHSARGALGIHFIC